MLRSSATIRLDWQPNDLHVRRIAMAALATTAVRHRLPSTGLAVVNVKLVTNVTTTLLTTTSSSTLLPTVTPNTTIAGTHRLTVISIPTITLSATPSAQPLKVHNRPTTIYQTTTITTLHVNVAIIDATTLTLVHVLAHVTVLAHVLFTPSQRA